MKRLRPLWALVCLVFFSLFFNVVAAHAAPPANFQSTLVVGSGLSNPVGIGFSPDNRLFILQRTGEIKIFKNGQLLAQNFATLPAAATGDRGLIGIAFDPNFSTNHYVYFWYTASEDMHNRLVRFNASGDVGTDGPVVLYQTVTPSQQLHVGGGLLFGNDGKIYLGVGDNGFSANAQDMSVPFGKILRLNKDGSIPSDNPYVGQSGILPEIWANGMRNPYRGQVDPQTGNIYFGDVGEETWEEVNLIKKGKNYGWPLAEGTCNASLTDCSKLTNPIFAYNHSGQSSAVTGGPVYRGSLFPAAYQGRYFFGDYARGFIRTLGLDANGNATDNADFDMSAGSVVDLKQAQDGSIYYVTFIPARIYRIDYSTGNHNPIANAGADVTKGTAPLTVHFTSAGTSDPDGDPLTYAWDFGDGTTSTAANPTKIFNNNGTYTVTLHVSDATHTSEAVPLVIQVGVPPTIIIASPANNSTYKAGDTIFYTASGTDGAGFDLHDADFTTEVLFHHDTHIHPFLGPITSKTGTFTTPTTGEVSPNTWFEIKISGKDSSGLSSTSTVNIYPEKSHFTLKTVPAGLGLNLDGQPVDPATIPLTVTGVVNFRRELDAPLFQQLNGKVYQFANWSDGGSNKHFIATPASDTTYTATYNEVPAFTGQYFNNQTLSGSPVLTRQDPFVNFDWGASSPGTGVNADHFSVRWSRTQAFGAGRYTFTTRTDDGVRLYVDGNLIIDKWIDQSTTPYSATLDLNSGNHTIVMEYYDNAFDAIAHLDWVMVPGPTPTATPIPTPTVVPSASPTTGPTATPSVGFKGEYWNTPGAGTAPTIPNTTPTLTRTDATVNFNWGLGSPDASINVDHFVARWTKTENFAAGKYTFKTDSDDGIRLYVDGNLVINQWTDHSTTTYTADVNLTAGNHDIKFEYYENAVDAVAKLSWTLTGPLVTPTPTIVPTATPTIAPTASPTVAPTATPGADVYTAQYFDNMTLTGTPKLTRNDATINFDWGTGSPDPVLPVDKFSVRWTKTINLPSGVYKFDAVGDDGIRAYVDGIAVIDQWKDQSPTGYTANVNITGGTHTIKFEFYENGGTAVAKMSYTRIGDLPGPTPTVAPTATPTVAPTASPTAAPTATPVSGAYSGQYWNVPGTGTAPAFPNSAPNFTRNDSLINFNWGTGSPNAAINVDHFVVRWTKTENLAAGSYTFNTVADDGIRVYLDGVVIIDQWTDHNSASFSTTKTLTAGNHDIKVEYYENAVDAIAQFNYVKN